MNIERKSKTVNNQKGTFKIFRRHFDTSFNDPTKIKNNASVEFNDENFDYIRFVEMNTTPAVWEHLTPRLFFDIAISNSVDAED